MRVIERILYAQIYSYSSLYFQLELLNRIRQEEEIIDKIVV